MAKGKKAKKMHTLKPGMKHYLTLMRMMLLSRLADPAHRNLEVVSKLYSRQELESLLIHRRDKAHFCDEQLSKFLLDDIACGKIKVPFKEVSNEPSPLFDHKHSAPEEAKHDSTSNFNGPSHDLHQATNPNCGTKTAYYFKNDVDAQIRNDSHSHSVTSGSTECTPLESKGENEEVYLTLPPSVNDEDDVSNDSFKLMSLENLCASQETVPLALPLPGTKGNSSRRDDNTPQSPTFDQFFTQSS